MLAAMPGRARAQVTRLPSVAVLEFGNLVNPAAGGILGRQATDAVVVEMTRTGRFDVTPRQQLNQQLQDLGLTLPLDNVEIQRLGQALSVDFVATGDITNISFTDKPRRATVTVSVRLTDVVSGEFANGAIQSGVSTEPAAGMQLDDDTLVSQAISKAAFNAVKSVNDYTLPEATILNTRGTIEVTLNRGGRDGINPGLEMIVVRGSQRVGKIRVITVGSTDATAAIIDPGKGIRPEDRARAIFSLPGIRISETGEYIRTPISDVRQFQPQRKRNKSIIGTILGIAGAVLLIGLLFGKKSRAGQSAGISKVTARAFADPSVTTALDPAAGRVRIEWESASDVPFNNIVQYHVFRDGQIIAALPRSQRSFVDQPTGLLPFDYTTLAFGGDGGGGNNNGGAALGTELDTVEDVVPPPLRVGVPHRYQVNVLYQRLLAPVATGTGGGGGGNQDNNIQYQETAVEASSSLATPITRPGALQPTTDQDLSRVRFTYRTVEGANQYVIELSDRPDFGNKQSIGPFFTSFTGGADSQTDIQDLNGRFPNTAGLRIYYRVGARNSNDSPGVDGGRNATPNGDAFIYSAEDRSFAIIGNPPPPPGGSTTPPGAPGQNGQI